MQIDDMILVSVDDHVVRAAGHVRAARAGEVEGRARRGSCTSADGTDVWVFEGQQIPNVGLNAVAGRPPEEYGMEPTSLAQLREGCYDVDARVDDMNANGMLGSMCFASMPGFCGELFGRRRTRSSRSVMLQAYNDWHIDEWCGRASGPLHPAGAADALGSEAAWPTRSGASRRRAATR